MPAKEKCDAVLATEELRDSSNNLEYFNYKGERANAYIHSYTFKGMLGISFRVIIFI